ncbi:MAG: ribonucleoside triphosphate reductase [Chlamydiota bacterium]
MSNPVDEHHNSNSFRETFNYIRKRDGRIVPFDASKITLALVKAARTTGEFDEDVARKLTLKVLSLTQAMHHEGSPPSIEDIQDIVEETLLNSTFQKTAKAYILYRDQHARIREMVKNADVDLIDSYLERLDWQVNENSNMDYSLQGLNCYISGEITKTYWLNKIYTPEIREAHSSGALHIHDMSNLSPYCVGWDLYDLLITGFKGAAGKVQSAPPKRFRAALGQVVNFFYTLQGESAGAQAFSSFDTLLAPFIKYEGLTYADVKQAMQEFIFNTNVPTRVGFQTPFTNITLDLQPPKTLAEEPVVIGGKLQKETYSEFQTEMNWINRAFLELMAEGDACGRVFTFPIPTYNITSDFDWDNPEIESLWEVAAKYGIPYFANFINSDLSPDDARSMCCRLRLDVRDLRKRGGGLFGSNPLTGSIGVATINLPQIGYLAKSEEDFFSRLDILMELARESLETKRKILEGFTDKGLYPYSKYYLRNIKKRHGNYWNNHFSTVGLVGMNEALLNFIGKDVGTVEGNAFAAKVLDHMRDKLVTFQEITGHIYNLEATPAEGTTYRLAKIDSKRLPGIITANPDSETPFYTNSSQLPVNYTNDILQMLEMQDNLQTKYTGGTVVHVFLGEAVADPQAVKNFVRKVCESFNLPYFTLSPTFSVCPDHGYLKGELKTCPTCQQKTEIYSRVVGYLRPTDHWNEGKKAEFEMRSNYQVTSTTNRC